MQTGVEQPAVRHPAGSSNMADLLTIRELNVYLKVDACKGIFGLIRQVKKNTKRSSCDRGTRAGPMKHR